MARRLSLLLAVILAVLTVAGTACSPPGEGDTGGDGATEPLSIGLAAPNAIYWAIYVGQAKGWFQDEGFQPQIVIARSSTGVVQQLSAGALEVGAATPDVVIEAVDKGSNITAFASTIEKSPLSVVARSEIETWSDLENKLIGISALEGGEITLLRRLLEEKGLSEDDYDVQIVGATPDKAAALSGDAIDAAVLFSPTDFAMEGKGFNILGSTAELSVSNQVPLAVYATPRDWAEEEKRGERVARVLYKANQWLLDESNKEEAIQIFAKAADQEPEHVEQTYELWFDKQDAWTETGLVTEEQMASMLDVMVEDGTIAKPLPDPSEFVTPDYVEAAQS